MSIEKLKKFSELLSEGLMCVLFEMRIGKTDGELNVVDGSFGFFGLYGFIDWDGAFKEMVKECSFSIIDDDIHKGILTKEGEYNCSLCFNVHNEDQDMNEHFIEYNLCPEETEDTKHFDDLEMPF